MSRATSPSKLQFWKERFDQFNDSQQTVQLFCKSAGCSEHSFYYWKRKLSLHASSTPAESGTPKSAEGTSAFVPVIVRGNSTRSIVVRVKDGTRIAIPADALGALEVVLQHAHRVA